MGAVSPAFPPSRLSPTRDSARTGQATERRETRSEHVSFDRAVSVGRGEDSGDMTTNLKADVRARMRVTGEKYTKARRGLLAERDAANDPGVVERVTMHTTRNGLPLAEADCEALTKAGRRCRNPFVYGQFWSGGHPEVLLSDGPRTRMLAQRRCRVHVDHTRHAEVVLVMDDVVPSPHSGAFPGPVWQDPRSLDLIRNATSGRARTETLAFYLALTECGEPDTLAGVGARCGLSGSEAEAAMSVLVDLGLVSNGTLVA